MSSTPGRVKPADFPTIEGWNMDSAADLNYSHDGDDGGHDGQSNATASSSSTSRSKSNPKQQSFRRAHSDIPPESKSHTYQTSAYTTPLAASAKAKTSSRSRSISPSPKHSNVNSSSTSSSSSKGSSNKKKLNRGLSFGPTRPGLHGGGNMRWFHNLFPLRQVFVPRVPFPLWDDNWDENRNNRLKLGERPSHLVVRHIFLIRHGQYHDREKNDSQRSLTDLGKKQAKLTGRRLSEIIRNAAGANSDGSCPLKSLSCSSLTRAKQTADIIHGEIQEMASKYNETNPNRPWGPIERNDPDPLLIEGFPVHHIPGPTGFTGLHVEEIDRDFPRAEDAFKKYIGTSEWLNQRDWSTPQPQLPKKKAPHIDHEYEIIVAHANVIRFMLCRALQVAPECWLRFNLYHCSMSYLVVSPNGHVNCRSLGDTGHITDHSELTIDNKKGLNWM